MNLFKEIKEEYIWKLPTISLIFGCLIFFKKNYNSISNWINRLISPYKWDFYFIFLSPLRVPFLRFFFLSFLSCVLTYSFYPNHLFLFYFFYYYYYFVLYISFSVSKSISFIFSIFFYHSWNQETLSDQYFCLAFHFKLFIYDSKYEKNKFNASHFFLWLTPWKILPRLFPTTPFLMFHKKNYKRGIYLNFSTLLDRKSPQVSQMK